MLIHVLSAPTHPKKYATERQNHAYRGHDSDADELQELVLNKQGKEQVGNSVIIRSKKLVVSELIPGSGLDFIIIATFVSGIF